MILVPDLRTILDTADSPAERLVARLLQQVDGDLDAVAFHSVKLRYHRHKQQAEADFVILWQGVVVIFEVKGGGVRKVDGRWWTIDRRNDWKPLNESPMDQANGAKVALRDILHAEGLGWYADQHAVITPDVEDVTRSIGWYPSHWLAAKDMTVQGLTKALNEIVATSGSPGRGVKLAPAKTIRAKLFGEFALLPQLDALRGAVIEEQNRATVGQSRYLAGLARSERIMVLGGAGTGKSLALAEGAKQENEQGRSTLITFRSRGLWNFFASLVGERGIDVIPFADLRGGREYDAVFVDEAQDLMNADDMDTLSTVISGGLADGRWRMFLDPNNQAHVDGCFDEDVLSLLLAESTRFDLPMNVRNTKAIVHLVQEYLGADVGDPGIVHGEPAHWHSTQGPADLQAAVQIAKGLVDQGARRDSLWIIDASSQNEPFHTETGFLVTSPKHAKGLEADRVIVCNLPTPLDGEGRAALYVAITRARVAVHIVRSPQDRTNLQHLIRERMGLL